MDFKVYPGFCKFCASVLPIIDSKSSAMCPCCKSEYDISAFGSMKASYTIDFNSGNKNYEKASSSLSRKKEKEVKAEGPVVERKCSKCGNDKMSYVTLQLRSADEGQTVFYTCTKCRHKETENS